MAIITYIDIYNLASWTKAEENMKEKQFAFHPEPLIQVKLSLTVLPVTLMVAVGKMNESLNPQSSRRGQLFNYQ